MTPKPPPPPPPPPPRRRAPGGGSAWSTAARAGAAGASAAAAGAACFALGMAVCTKIESPQMIGVDVPRPGSLTFQRTFLPSPQVSGGSAVGAAPLASGPRHCGQFESVAGVVVVVAAANAA